MIAHADEATDIARSFLERINEVILYPLIILLLAVALVVFLYGAFEYVTGLNSPERKAKGQTHLLYGILGMVVMVSAYAILRIAAGTFGIEVPR